MMSIPALNPATDIAAPRGATHFELLYIVSALDFAAGTYTQEVVTTTLGILAPNSPALVNRDIVAAFPVPRPPLRS